jgi:hypothetical protein
VARLSQLLLPTERQPPADAEALSHKLMVRAGLVRQVGAGLWSWLPAGWRVHQNVVQIVREEMDRVGCQEMLMPVITPAELWKKSGRYGISEVFHLKDRRDADLVLAMTHEETVTTHVAAAVRSYRDLPKLLYHFQTKARDEPRPRAGILRTREFIMKDAYSFDRDQAGLDESYATLAWSGTRSSPTSAPWAAPGPTSTWRRAPRARTTSPWRRATPPTSRWRAPIPGPCRRCPSGSPASCTRRARRRSRPWPTSSGCPGATCSRRSRS